MQIIVCSRYSSATIGAAIGEPEYSYYFVLKEFLPLLEAMGKTHTVESDIEADELYRKITDAGDTCLFLQFTAPHNLARSTRCPAIPVFAWEFSSIPHEAWGGDGFNNWKLALKRCGAAITHSEATVDAVKAALGQNFPIISVPAPVWDKCASLRTRLVRRMDDEPDQLIRSTTLEFRGVVCDSRDVDFGAVLNNHFTKAFEVAPDEGGNAEAATEYARKPLRVRLGTAKNLCVQIYRECIADLLPGLVRSAISKLYRMARPLYRTVLRSSVPPSAEVEPDEGAAQGSDEESSRTGTDKLNVVELTGVVYTSLFNPYDGRKNWETMLTAFCWTFKENEDATLLIKVSANQIVAFTDQVVDYLSRLQPFKCRVVVIKAFLEDEHYQRLLEATSYYVNTSYGEGQCLPLMEFLSSGVPAIAPGASAMADYMSSEVGFVVDSSPELTSWQHDERKMMRTFHHRVDWTSTAEAFRASYEIIKRSPASYRKMSQAAAANMKRHCSLEVLRGRLEPFLKQRVDATLPEARRDKSGEEIGSLTRLSS